MKRLEATVYGNVQGVNFRHYTQKKAGELDINGWVANKNDGTVSVVAEGDDKAMEEFEQFLHHGSPAASVRKIETNWTAATGEFNGFQVRWLR